MTITAKLAASQMIAFLLTSSLGFCCRTGARLRGALITHQPFYNEYEVQITLIVIVFDCGCNRCASEKGASQRQAGSFLFGGKQLNLNS